MLKSISQQIPIKARENPFRSQRLVEFRYHIDSHQLDRMVGEIEAANRFRLSIMGPEGTGKTVLLEDLASRFQEKEWVKIREDDPGRTKCLAALRLRDKKDQRILFFDGGECLPSFCWSAFWLGRKKLLATCHTFRPHLRVLHKTEYQPDVAIRMVTHLLGRRLSSSERNQIHDWGECSGNLREVLRMCYRSNMR